MAKICHLTSVHPTFENRIFEKQCKSIKAAGHEISLVVTHDKDEVVDGIPIKGVPQPRNRFERMFLTTWRVFRRGLAEKADLYQIHDPELLPWTVVLRLLGKPAVYDMHENMTATIKNKRWIHPAIRQPLVRLYSALERLLIGQMPVIFADKSIIKSYPWVRNHILLQNLPDLDTLLNIPIDAPYETPTVGYMGRVAKIRGSVMTLEALRILKENGLNVDWECVGTAPDNHPAELETMAKQYGLDGVRMRGYMRAKDGWSIMARCQAGMMVLYPTVNAKDAAPTKMFEYMALGIPLISSDFPRYREFIDEAHCGLCVDPQDPQAIAEAIRYLIEHPEEARAMGQRGRAIVSQKYNWQTEVQNLLALYDRVLKN